MFKLNEKEVQVLVQIDEKIKELREKQQSILKKLVTKHGGSVEGFVKIDNPGEDVKPYVRAVIVDNLEDFTSGEPLYRNTAFSRYTLDIARLKNEPKPTLEQPIK